MRVALCLGLLAALVAGGVAGIAWERTRVASTAPAPSEFLTGFRLPEVAVEGAPLVQWEILDDRLDDRLPAFSRSPRVARRLIAQARMTPRQLDQFVSEFSSAVSDGLQQVGAIGKLHVDIARGRAGSEDGRPYDSRLHLPRRAYSLADSHGVVDAGYIAEDGRVTVIVFIEEGR